MYSSICMSDRHRGQKPCVRSSMTEVSLGKEARVPPRQLATGPAGRVSRREGTDEGKPHGLCAMAEKQGALSLSLIFSSSLSPSRVVLNIHTQTAATHIHTHTHAALSLRISRKRNMLQVGSTSAAHSTRTPVRRREGGGISPQTHSPDSPSDGSCRKNDGWLELPCAAAVLRARSRAERLRRKVIT